MGTRVEWPGSSENYTLYYGLGGYYRRVVLIFPLGKRQFFRSSRLRIATVRYCSFNHVLLLPRYSDIPRHNGPPGARNFV